MDAGNPTGESCGAESNQCSIPVFTVPFPQDGTSTHPSPFCEPLSFLSHFGPNYLEGSGLKSSTSCVMTMTVILADIP